MINVYFLLGLTFMELVLGILPPRDGNVESRDLDFNLTWIAPADIEEVLKISYTVYYAEHTSIYLDNSVWNEVPGCINLTLTYCRVTSVTDSFRDFTTKAVLRIEATDEETGNTSKPLQVELFPDRHVHLSSPTIDVGKVSHQLVTLRLFGPMSPYRDLKDTGRILRVEEVAPSLVDQIYYNVTLEGRETREIKRTTARYPFLEFSDLFPGSEYKISAYIEFHGIFETTHSQTSTKFVYTTLDAKLNKPLDVEVKDQKVINCTHPDVRNIEVTWKRPLKYEYISFYDMSVWTDGHEPSVKSFVIPADINRTRYSFSLSNIPRWSSIGVIVFANTSVAGCASFKSTLYPHTVDEKRSQPENLSASRTSFNTWKIFWEPPSSCQECIVGYEVFWELAINKNSRNVTRDIVANDVLQYEIFQGDDDVTVVEVSTLLKSGRNMQKTGETAVLGIYYEEPGGFVKTITVCLGVAVLSMLIVLLYFCKSKSKRRWKEDSNILSIFSSPMCHNEQSKLFRQYSFPTSSGQPYSRSIYVREPEIFDELLPLKKTTNSVDETVSEKTLSGTNPNVQDSGNCDPD